MVLTRRFNAPRRLVFDALTKPELVRRWYGPPGAMDICESDTRVGGTWRYVTRLKNGKTVGQFGVYKEVVAPHRFVRTERWDDWDPGETLVTTVLVEHGGITTMTSLDGVSVTGSARRGVEGWTDAERHGRVLRAPRRVVEGILEAGL